MCFFFFKQKTAYEVRISDWSSDVCSSDLWSDGSYSWYCNTIPTPAGDTHEAGLRAALTKGLRAFGELIGQKKAAQITAEDVFNGGEMMLSFFIRDPQFQSQTKARLSSSDAARLPENAVRAHSDHFMSANMDPLPA